MTESTTYISTSGGLISQAFVENIRGPESRQRGMESEMFTLPWVDSPKTPAALEEHIATVWDLLLERWDAIASDLPMMEISQLRNRWLMPFFELLDFTPVYQRGDTVIGEDLRFDLSHRGWEYVEVLKGPVLHSVAPQQELDARQTIGRGTSMKAKSPHDMLQAYLNLSPEDDWAILTNGILLRILRDYHHTFTQGYVEFDLESIFETRNFADFRALYRLCHASRFLPLEEASEEGEEAKNTILLESFYKESIASGIKVGEDLRDQVRQAIESLGNGFMDGALLAQLQESEDACQGFFAEILRVVYRVLFLLFAEQRGMLPGRGSLYSEAYSISKLREKAERAIPQEDDHTDLWEGLKVTFRMVREGAPELNVFGYDGMLFEDANTNVSEGDESSYLHKRACRNSDLLRFIRALTLIDRSGVLQRISFADLGVEELGSIYESLLDFTSRVTTDVEEIEGREIAVNIFYLDPRGSARKTTGSYYTHPSLVNELIKSALLPVLRDRLERIGLPVIKEKDIGETMAGMLKDYTSLTEDQRRDAEKAILDIKVCDPAAGSGHFLIRANDALAAELARIRLGQEYPPQDEIQNAKHDVLVHCIYAVDVNPMAVELCKVSLWINAAVKDKPLSFLDHHIKCGNSLIGTIPELMEDGIPYEAFGLGLTGDSREVAKELRERNRKERKQYEKTATYQMPLRAPIEVSEEEVISWEELSRLADAEPNTARERYAEYLADKDYQRKKLEADFWTVAFFWPMPDPNECDHDGCGLHGPHQEIYAPTFGEFMVLVAEGPDALPKQMLERVENIAFENRFFHWPYEFEEVFGGDESGGFDVMLGNPPWERIKLEEKEFFAICAPEIAEANTAAKRRLLINHLRESSPSLYLDYSKSLHSSECLSSFLRESSKYPLTAHGDINTYAIFAELMQKMICPYGRVGVLLPTGIATDHTTRQFFEHLVEGHHLARLVGFENEAFIFPSVHHAFKFCAMTLTGSEWNIEESDLAFLCRYFHQVDESIRHFTLTSEEFTLLNPNTKTCPVFRTKFDAELTKKIYRRAGVLVNDGAGKDPWNVKFLAMFHMTNDSGLFHDESGEGLVPLYEAKMIHQFDHRYATYEGATQANLNVGILPQPEEADKMNPSYQVKPRYWVPKEEVENRLSNWDKGWLLTFRDITSNVVERTSIFSLIPRVGVGNSAPILFPSKNDALLVACLLSNVNSIVFDYIARQKISGTHMNFFLLKQLPVLPPDSYSKDTIKFIVERVGKLVYTSFDMRPFSEDVGFVCDPFIWNDQNRAIIRSELDALFAILYGLNYEELEYILLPADVYGEDFPGETFRVLKENEERKYGEYRTKRLVLEAYNRLVDEAWAREVKYQNNHVKIN